MADRREKKKKQTRRKISGPSVTNRSAITNGSRILEHIDGRSAYARRYRDLVHLHVADCGGPDQISEAERGLIRRCAALGVELERMESRFVSDEGASLKALETFQRASNSLRRLYEAIGLKRRTKDITPANTIDHTSTLVEAARRL